MQLNKLLCIITGYACLSFPFPGKAQELGAGKYPLDTPLFYLAHPSFIYEYYSLRIKYPLSSEALTRKARQEVVFPEGFKESGYVTVRFIVNGRGELGCFHIYEIDTNCMPATFDHSVSDSLQHFVNSLQYWPTGKRKGKPVDYFSFLTFKIDNGVITNIAP